MLYALIAAIVLIADQWLKYWVSVNITLATGAQPLIPGVVKLVNVHNTGAAFSLLSDVPFARWIFLGLAVAACIGIIIVISKRVFTNKFATWCMVLFATGALGNCFDRALYGYVVDMFKLEFVNFAVFNFADILLVVSFLLFFIYLFVGGKDEDDEEAVVEVADAAEEAFAEVADSADEEVKLTKKERRQAEKQLKKEQKEKEKQLKKEQKAAKKQPKEETAQEEAPVVTPQPAAEPEAKPEPKPVVTPEPVKETPAAKDSNQIWADFRTSVHPNGNVDEAPVERGHRRSAVNRGSAVEKKAAPAVETEKPARIVTPEPVKETPAVEAEKPARIVTPEPVKEAPAAKAEKPAPKAEGSDDIKQTLSSFLDDDTLAELMKLLDE